MFARTLSKSIFLLISLVIIVCIIYPLILWIIGQIFFPFQANGSIIYDANNKPIGSLLIAQPFTKEEYFQPRPSAASYDASASSSSALAASNPALRKRVVDTLNALTKFHKTPLQNVPGDLVTTSASGLDPHISLQNAEFQLDRVATKWASNLKRNPEEVKTEIEQILQKSTQAPFGGLIGEKFISVLEVNLKLQEKYGKQAHG